MIRFLTTAKVHERDRVAYWRQAISDVFVRLDCDTPVGEPFHGVIRQRGLSMFDISEIVAAPQHVARSARQITRDHADAYFICLMLDGSAAIAQDGRKAMVHEGCFGIYDSTRPYELTLEETFRSLVLRMPRRLLHDQIGHLYDLTAKTFTSDLPAAAMTVQLLTSFWANVDGAKPRLADKASQWVLDALSEALVEDRPALRMREYSAASLQRIKAAVEVRLSRSDAALSEIASELGFSLRHINRLFATEGLTLGSYMRLRRLEKARSLLDDFRHDHRSVTNIALACGFQDPAYFSRAFQRHFGIGPRSCRTMRKNGGAAPSAAGSA